MAHPAVLRAAFPTASGAAAAAVGASDPAGIAGCRRSVSFPHQCGGTNPFPFESTVYLLSQCLWLAIARLFAKCHAHFGDFGRCPHRRHMHPDDCAVFADAPGFRLSFVCSLAPGSLPGSHRYRAKCFLADAAFAGLHTGSAKPEIAPQRSPTSQPSGGPCADPHVGAESDSIPTQSGRGLPPAHGRRQLRQPTSAMA